jgi:hypothetical protein
MNSSIIANQGFIERFGRTDPGGAKFLPAKWISIWGGIFATTQVVGEFSGGWMVDTIGRK